MSAIFYPTKNPLEIIVVDDDSVIRLLHSSKIRQLFAHKLSVHADGKAALDFLDKKRQGSSDFLILLDLNMPVFDGWSFLEELPNHKLPFRVYIIIVSSSINQTDKQRAFQYDSVLDYFEKPLLEKHFLGIPKIWELEIYFDLKTKDTGEIL